MLFSVMDPRGDKIDQDACKDGLSGRRLKAKKKRKKEAEGEQQP